MIEIGDIYFCGETSWKVLGDNPPKQFFTEGKTWCAVVELDGTSHGHYHILNEYLIDKVK